MKNKWSIPLKAALGYALFVVLLTVAARSLYGYVRFATRTAEAGEAAARRRTAVDGLVRRLFEVENAERAVCLGDTGRWADYERALAHADTAAVRLAAATGDKTVCLRLDSLRLLLAARRENSRELLADIGLHDRHAPYRERAARLRSGKDSMLFRPAAGGQIVKEERTYVVERPRRKFFGRVADVFRRSRADTAFVSERTVLADGDSAARSFDIGDSVANFLAGIERQAGRSEQRLQYRMRRASAALQTTGIELTARIGRIMESIGQSEQRRLHTMAGQELAARRTWAWRLGALAAAALLLAGVSLAGIVRDVARAGRYRRQLEEARRRAEELLAQRERLMLTVTHDIKAPAASIAGFMELLAQRPHDDETRHYLKSIRSSADHLLQLVGALLDYHRLESGRVELRPTTFCPARMLDDTVAGFQPLAAEKGIALRFDATQCGTRACRADAFRIRQVVENLLGNALKFTNEGYVVLTATLADGCLTLAVSDTGPGMTEAERERIFGAFERLPQAQGTEGVGLGLSITREVVALLGGTLTVESVCGTGSTFTAVFPVSETVAAAHAESGCTGQPETESTCGARRRILVIDDNATQLELTSAMLRKLSGGQWETFATTDVGQLLQAIRDERFDALLTDIEMPAVSGFELLEKVRTIVPDSSILPVVALTAHGLMDEKDFVRVGFAACLSKPFTMAELGHTVGRVMGETTSGIPAAERTYGFGALTAFADGDPQAERIILERFGEDVKRHAAELRRAAETEDKAEAGRLAHKLLPTLAMIGSSAVPALESLEARRQESVWTDTDAICCEEILSELERIGTELTHISMESAHTGTKSEHIGTKPEHISAEPERHTPHNRRDGATGNQENAENASIYPTET